MPTDAPSESGGTGGDSAIGSFSFYKHTDLQGSRLDTYRLSCVPSSVGDTPLSTARPAIRRDRKADAEKTSGPIDPTERYAVARLIDHCAESAREMDQAIADSDTMGLATAAHQLKSCLSDMWRSRRIRGEQWGSAVNFVQASLAGVQYEQLTAPHCAALRSVVEGFLVRAALDEDDVQQVVEILEGGGLDPWHVLSPDAGPTDEG